MAEIKVELDLNDGENTIEIDRTKLTEVNSTSQMTSSPADIKYGSISNTGSFTINDYNDEIKEKIADGTLDVSGVVVSVYEDDHLIQRHISRDSDYNNVDKTFSVELSNKLLLLDTLKYKGYVYQDAPITVYVLLFDVLNDYYGGQLVSEDDAIYKNMLSAYMLHPVTGQKVHIWEYAQDIVIKYPSIEYGRTYRDVINELCTILQCYMYINDEDYLVFEPARPISENADVSNAIRITKDKMYSSLQDTVILKNKFDGVEISESDVEEKINYNAVLNTSNETPLNFTNGNMDAHSAYDAMYGHGTKIESLYSDGVYSFNRKSKDNLKQTIMVNYDESSADADGYCNILLQNGQLPYSNTFYVYDGWFMNESQTLSDMQNNVFQTTFYYNNVSFDSDNSYIYTGKANTIVYDTDSLSTPSSVSDNSYIKVKEDVDVIHVKYHLLSEVVHYRLQTNHYNSFRRDTGSTNVYVRKHQAKSMSISIYGDEREIVFNESSASSTDIDSAKTIASVQTGKLVQNVTQVGSTLAGDYEDGVKITDVIKSTILDDYANGIADARVTVCCDDFYNASGTKIIDWSQGETLQVGQVVFFTDVKNVADEPKYWRITGRKFYWEGAPYCDLELQELKYPTDGLYQNGELVYTYDELIDNNLMTVSNKRINSFNNSLTGTLRIKNHRIESIKNEAFAQTSLTEIYLPSSLTEIGYMAFYYSSTLYRVDMGNGVVKIGYMAFEQCSNLTYINIPSSIQYVGSDAFRLCSNLVYQEYDNGKYLGNENNAYTMLLGIIDNTVQSFSIKNGCRIIGSSAVHYCTSLTNVNIPYTVITICAQAFEGCSSLTNINIPNSVKTLCVNCFLYCSGLQSFVIPDGVETIEAQIFSYCSSLTTVTIGKNVKDIKGPLFGNCNILDTIYFNATDCLVTSVEYYLLYNAGANVDGITIYIGESVEKINNRTFQGSKVTDIIFDENCKCKIIGDSCFSNSSIQSIVLPDSIESIGYGIFSGCSSLTSVTLGENLNYIYYRAFYGCNTLTSVVFSNAEGWRAYNCVYEQGRYVPTGNGTAISSSDLEDSDTAITYLTNTYINKIWQRR